MTTRVTRASATATIEFLFKTIGWDDNRCKIVSETLAINSIDRLLTVTQDVLLIGTKLTGGDVVDVLNMQKYVYALLSDEQKPFPTTIQDWRENLAKKSFWGPYFNMDL